MSDRSFFTRLGQHISFVYNQIVLYPVQSIIIAFNIIFVVGGVIACRRYYVKSSEEDVLMEKAKIRKRRKKYERSEKSSSSDSSEPQSTIVDIESNTDSEPKRGSVVCYNFHQTQPKQKCKRQQEDTPSDSDDSSTMSSVSDSAVTIDIDSSESSDESEDPLPIFGSPKKSNKVPRGRSPFTHCSKFEPKKTSSCTQTEVKVKPVKKTTATQTGQKRNSSTQTTNKNMANCDCNDDSNDSEFSWYHAIQRFRKKNIAGPTIPTGRYKKYSHLDGKEKHKYKKKGGKKTIFGVALKPVCNSDCDETHLVRNFDPNLTNHPCCYPRVK